MSVAIDFTLSALLQRLGGQPAALPVPRPDQIAEIGTLHGLPAWAAEPGSDPAPLARRLARSGHVGLLLGHHSVPGQFTATVTLAPIRVQRIPSNVDAMPLVRRIARLLEGEQVSLLTSAVALADAIDLDGAGRRTFALLHTLIERGVDALPADIPRADRHAWLLMHCTRLLFLRFVEAEGWLDGNPAFLAGHFDRLLQARRDPLRDYLEPLFFGTLNRPQHERLRIARAFGRIPFLNGGLFEPHPIERKWRIAPPVGWWEEVFTALTGRIEVTLDPAPSGGEVTPEMLGRVFEGVMAAGERKDAGAFYTPQSLVRALLVAALAPLVAQRLQMPEEAIERRFEDPDPGLLRLLGQLRLLDPAVGSGAFLVGALDILHGPGIRNARRTRQLVTESLHGIDRHPGAVRITELRLWLEVLRPLRGAPPERIPPLPNLDAAVRAGDALIDPLHGLEPRERPVAAAAALRRLAGAHGEEKRQLLDDIRAHERATVLATLDARDQELSRGIAERLEVARTRTLFGDTAGVTPEARSAVRQLREERAALRREWRAIAREEQAAPFAPAVAFGAILRERGGFDLVIGNPPWVRAERLPARMRQMLGTRYRWWRGQAGRGFRHQPDLAVAFVERSLELIRPGGTLALLVPGKLATTQYATAMREGLTRRTTLRCVADLSDDPRAVFQATTYPMAIVAEKTLPSPSHRVRLSLGNPAVTTLQEQMAASDRWPLGAVAAHQVARRLVASHPSIGESFRAQLGVKTGANALFLNPPVALTAWTRTALRGRDISRGPTAVRGRLLWPLDAQGEPLAVLPGPVADYLEPHRARLVRRADLHDDRWWRLFRTAAATAAHRVAWSDLARHLAAIIPGDDTVPLNSCYLIATPDRRTARLLCTWLNATWVRAMARLGADPAAQGYARFSARVVAALPWPAGITHNQSLLDLSVSDGPIDQAALDELVADVLSLSSSDRAQLAPLAAPRR